MAFYICTACGTQHAESKQPPTHCVICEEERQYIPPRGQTWTTLDALRQSHTNTFREYEKGIIGIGSTPGFAIGQRALLVRTDNGNILWDCIAPLDDATVTMVEGLGGIDAIAISHPHFYTYSLGSGGPILVGPRIHADNRPRSSIQAWFAPQREPL